MNTTACRPLVLAIELDGPSKWLSLAQKRNAKPGCAQHTAKMPSHISLTQPSLKQVEGAAGKAGAGAGAGAAKATAAHRARIEVWKCMLLWMMMI